MERKKQSDFTSDDPGIDSKKRKSADKKPEVRNLSENKSDQPHEKTSKVVGYFNDLVKIGTKSMKGKSGREKTDDTEMDELLADVEKKIAEAENAKNENLSENNPPQGDNPRIISISFENASNKTPEEGVDAWISPNGDSHVTNFFRPVNEEVAGKQGKTEKSHKLLEIDGSIENGIDANSDYETPHIDRKTQNKLIQAMLAFDAKNPLVIPADATTNSDQVDEFRSTSVGGNDKRSDLDEVNKLAKKITEMGNQLISDCTRQRSDEGGFYEHLKHAETSGKISPEFRAYIYEFRNTLNKINSPEMSRAVIAGFDTTVDSVGGPGTYLKEPVGKDNPWHNITYRIPPDGIGVFINGKRALNVKEIWGSGQKSELMFDDHTKEWIIDQSSLETGTDSNTEKTRPLHTGEIINPKNNHIIPDPVIPSQVYKTGEKIKIDGEDVHLWVPNPQIGVGKELAHTSDRYPRALSKHFLKHYDANRKETIRLFSFKDHRLLENDQKKVRNKAWDLFIKVKKETGNVLDLDACFYNARKDKKLKPRFNNDNTYPPMDYEQKWIKNLPDDEMPKSYGKSYGDKTLKEIYGLMEQYGVRGATSGTKRYYAGDDPIIEKQFDEYMKDLLQKVEIRGEFKDLAADQKYVLTKSREIAEYINNYLYHPLFGSMSIDIDSQKEQVTQDKSKDDYGKHSEKFDEFINLLDDYGVPKKEFILPTEKIGFDLDDRKNMLQEFVDKNPYPLFDRTKINEDLQSKDSKIDNKHVKTNDLSPTTELINQILNLTENGNNSGEAFIKSFNGKKKEILDFNIGGTLKHYHQNFRGLNGKLGNNQYNIPPGTELHTSDEIKREYNSFYKPVFDRNKLIKEFHNQMQNLEIFHQEMLQNKSTLEFLNKNNYADKIENIIISKLKKFEPIHDNAYSNFKQIYDYSGDPNRPRNNPRTDEMKFIWKLFDNTNTKFHRLINQKLKSNSNN